MQADNLCIDSEVHKGTLKYIGKIYHTFWNHEGSLKFIGKKHQVYINIEIEKNNDCLNHTLKYIPLDYHQVSS